MALKSNEFKEQNQLCGPPSIVFVLEIELDTHDKYNFFSQVKEKEKVPFLKNALHCKRRAKNCTFLCPIILLRY